jgi:hypothetical protein
MSAALAVVAPRLGQLIRLLGSDRDGEVVAAARALKRTLATAGQDFHDLAVGIERLAAGAQTARREVAVDWRAIAQWLVEHRARLTPKEQIFVRDMTNWGAEPTERQFAWLLALFERICSRADAA